MSLFTPITGIIGGSLIGASCSTLLLMNGDIMGISGCLSNTLLHPIESMTSTSKHWRLVFLGSFLLTVNFYVNHVEGAVRDTRLEESADVPIPSLLAHILGGFFVGLGTKLGNGCTTGHGVCGLSRFSKRSIIAVLTFTSCSVATAVLISSPNTPWADRTAVLRTSTLPWVSRPLGTAVTAVGTLWALLRTFKQTDDAKLERKVYGASLSGILMALGLAISGMTKKSKVNDFLDVGALSRGEHDPTLVTVLSSAILVSMLSYEFLPGYGKVYKGKTLEHPLGASDWSGIPTNKVVDAKLIGGSALFGLGWGLVSLCPGPALYAAGAGVVNVVCGWFPAYCAGSYLGVRLKAYWDGSDKKKKTA